MNPVTVAHFHLVLCHVPALLVLLGTGWLVAGFWRRAVPMHHTALVLFVLAAVAAVPLYMTGETSIGVAKNQPGFSDRLVEQHEAAAGVALGGSLVLGIAAGTLMVLKRALGGWMGWGLLGVALVVAGLQAWTANRGGLIRHPEIRQEAAS